jgi:hypothetical protein
MGLHGLLQGYLYFLPLPTNTLGQKDRDLDIGLQYFQGLSEILVSLVPYAEYAVFDRRNPYMIRCIILPFKIFSPDVNPY